MKQVNKEAHTPNTKFGMGDYYGRGIKAPLGRVRSESIGAPTLKNRRLKTPPKSIA